VDRKHPNVQKVGPVENKKGKKKDTGGGPRGEPVRKIRGTRVVWVGSKKMGVHHQIHHLGHTKKKKRKKKRTNGTIG